MQRDVIKIDGKKFFSNVRKIDREFYLIGRRNRYKRKPFLTLKKLGSKYSIQLEDGFFTNSGSKMTNKIEKRSKRLIIRTHKHILVENTFILTQTQYTRLLDQGEAFINKENEILQGEHQLLVKYSEGGEFENKVYCLATAQNWDLWKYEGFLLCPLMIKRLMSGSDPLLISLEEIKKSQSKFKYFDHFVSADYLFNNTVLHQKLYTYLLNLGDEEPWSDLIYGKSIVHQPKDLFWDCLLAEKLVEVLNQQNWYYSDQIYTNCALAWQLINRDHLNDHLEYTIKNFSVKSKIKASHLVEINAVNCKYALIVIKENHRVMCHSPLMLLDDILNFVNEYFTIDQSFFGCICAFCQKMRGKIEHQKNTLKNLCLRKIRSSGLEQVLTTQLPDSFRQQLLN